MCTSYVHRRDLISDLGAKYLGSHSAWFYDPRDKFHAFAGLKFVCVCVCVCVCVDALAQRGLTFLKNPNIISAHTLSFWSVFLKLFCLIWLHNYFHFFLDLRNVFQDVVLFSRPAWRSRCSESLRAGRSKVRSALGVKYFVFVKIVQTGDWTQPTSSNGHRFFFRQVTDIYPFSCL
jgi:hypothetical protein